MIPHVDMNKYIKYDLEDATTQMRVAIMNALDNINSGECKEISLGKYISGALLLECLEDSKWSNSDSNLESNEWNFWWNNWKTPSELMVDIIGNLFYNHEWILKVHD